MTDVRKAEDVPGDVKDPLLSALTNETEPPDEEALKEAAKTGDDAATGGPPAGRSSIDEAKRKGPVGWLQLLGPGLITGASDDDPSGIGTYAQVGSQYGYGLLWTALIALISRPARSNSSGVRRVGLPKVKPWMPIAM
jgi:hypothetical protein